MQSLTISLAKNVNDNFLRQTDSLVFLSDRPTRVNVHRKHVWIISSDVYGLIAEAGQQLSLPTRFQAYYHIVVHTHLKNLDVLYIPIKTV